MTPPLIVVTGTGTEIGKTHVACAVLLRWATRLRESGVAHPRLLGIKPIESGVPRDGSGPPTDTERLSAASTTAQHARPPYVLEAPISPHRAAALEGRTIEREVVVSYTTAALTQAEGVLLELPGGLFSPYNQKQTNADLVSSLPARKVLVVAPDRLGVLHDLRALTLAAASINLQLEGIILVRPERADASTGTNAQELQLLVDVPVLAVLPRGTPAEIAKAEGWDALDEVLLAPSRPHLKLRTA
jgi:dethiobiotin synthetase